MGYERPGEEIGFLPADIDMSGMTGTEYTYQFVPIWIGPAVNIVGHGNGGAALQAKGARTDPPAGVLQNAPVRGEPGNVMTTGVTKIKAAGTWAVGDPIGVDGSGNAVKAGTGAYAFGTALESAVAGDISTMLLMPRGVQ